VLPEAVDAEFGAISADIERKRSSFANQLEHIDAKLSKMEGGKEVDAIKDKVSKTKSELNKIDTKNIDPASVKKIENLREGVRKEIKTRKTSLQSVKESHKKLDQKIENIERIQDVVAVGQAAADVYSIFSSSDPAIEEVNQQLKSSEETMKKLENYEINIYTQMLPMVQGIKDKMDGLAENNDGKTHSALDVEQWRVTEYITDMKDSLGKMTKGFEMSEELQTCLNKVGRAMQLVLQLFHRIEDTKEKSEFASFMADINSNAASEIKVKNPVLNKLVTDVQISIKINIIIEAYERGSKSYLQSQFPFGLELVNDNEIPSKLRIGNSTANLVTFASQRIRKMMSNINERKTTISRLDSLVKNAPFREGFNRQFPPFYTWYYEENKEAIGKLLDGQTIEMIADIKTYDGETAYMDAVKFVKLKLTILPRKKSDIEIVKSAMNSYYISLKNLGEFNYKCGDKYFVMYNEPFIIGYSYKSESDGEPVSMNDVYPKIRDSAPMFSPFGRWNITLENAARGRGNRRGRGKDETEENPLAKLKGMQLDMQFSGKGVFMEQNSGICDARLAAIYRRDQPDPNRQAVDNEFLTMLREQ